MEANFDSAGAPLPDGVLVIRALSRGDVAPQRIFRLTMGAGTEIEPAVAIASSLDELHRAIDEWVSALVR